MYDAKKVALEIAWSLLPEPPESRWADRIEAALEEAYRAGMLRAIRILQDLQVGNLMLPKHIGEVANELLRAEEAIRAEAEGRGK